MGVDRDFYVILGYELDADKVSEATSKLEVDEYDDIVNGDIRLIEDQMCGNYAFFGKVLYSAFQHPNEPAGIIEPQDNDARLNVRNKLLTTFGEDITTEETKGIPKIIAFEHYC